MLRFRGVMGGDAPVDQFVAPRAAEAVPLFAEELVRRPKPFCLRSGLRHVRKIAIPITKTPTAMTA